MKSDLDRYQLERKLGWQLPAGTHLQVEQWRVDIASCCQLSAVDCINDGARVLQWYALPTAAAGPPSPTCSREAVKCLRSRPRLRGVTCVAVSD